MHDHSAENIYASVIGNRRATADARPMPTTRDNILFARTEAVGELLEAHILRPATQYHRNHAKEHSAPRELAQTLHQIASALITLQEEEPDVERDPWIRIHAGLDQYLTQASYDWSLGDKRATENNLIAALRAAIHLAKLMYLDPEQIVEDENARILAKLGISQAAPAIDPEIARAQAVANQIAAEWPLSHPTGEE